MAFDSGVGKTQMALRFSEISDGGFNHGQDLVNGQRRKIK